MAEIGYIQVTRDCNQKCIICSNPPNNQGLDFRRAKKEVDELAVQKYKQVILTGGEPTLYDKLPELISHCLKRKIFPRIITNGQRIADFKYLT
ncbi:radical SAM protein, partial [Patescibacteria group bacterium]|nr:radical SAM protein [Patescibacteria group bacterium]